MAPSPRKLVDSCSDMPPAPMNAPVQPSEPDLREPSGLSPARVAHYTARMHPAKPEVCHRYGIAALARCFYLSGDTAIWSKM